jgi:pyrimidine and pyridine-specific 5'-nucleotidase
VDEDLDQSVRDLNFIYEGEEETEEEEVEDFDMITEVDDESVVEEDLLALLRQIKVYHNRQLTHYKRLLEQTQTSASSQMHALQAEARVLRSQLAELKANIRQLEISKLDPQLIGQAPLDDEDCDPHGLFSARLCAGFNTKEVKKAVKALPRSERRRL